MSAPAIPEIFRVDVTRGELAMLTLLLDTIAHLEEATRLKDAKRIIWCFEEYSHICQKFHVAESRDELRDLIRRMAKLLEPHT